MTIEAYSKLSADGKVLAQELMEIKKILLELRDGVQAIEGEENAKQI